MSKSILLLFLILSALVGCQHVPPPERLLLVTLADTDPVPRWQRGYPSATYNSLSPQIDKQLSLLEQYYPLERVDGWRINPLGVYCAVFAVHSSADFHTTLDQLGENKVVKLVEPMQQFEVLGATNSPRTGSYFDLQYGKYATQVRRLQKQATGAGVKIAVIDTGMDRTHPDLKNRIKFARNFVEDGEFDRDIHGTAVAGIIASGFSDTGAVGLAPEADIYAYKACWPRKANSLAAQCNSFTLAKALATAIEQKVDIINLSLTGPPDALLSQLLTLALQQHSLIIAAQRTPTDFPASFHGVIAVSNSISHAHFAWASAASLQAEADASELLSTSPGGHYDFFSGSSMATARISGLTALLKQNNQSLTASQAMQGINQLIHSLNVAQRDD